MLLLLWCPFKIQKENLAGLQFTSTDYLSLVLAPLRIRWTIPLIFFGCTLSTVCTTFTRAGLYFMVAMYLYIYRLRAVSCG
jgi:hypothetical protein